MKSIIIYYSNSGTTEALAKRIQGIFGGELISIVPRVPYGSYGAAIKRAGKERKNKEVAEYDAQVCELTDIDIIFVGYPIWYSDAPEFVLDYLRKYDFAGKTLIPFATSGASNIKGTLVRLHEAAKGAKLEHPFTQKKLGKGNFDKWIQEIKADNGAD